MEASPGSPADEPEALGSPSRLTPQAHMSFLVRAAIVSFSALTLDTTSSGSSSNKARLPLIDVFKLRMTEG